MSIEVKLVYFYHSTKEMINLFVGGSSFGGKIFNRVVFRIQSSIYDGAKSWLLFFSKKKLHALLK